MGLALITGASAGLGAEFAKLFAADGHHVILVARRRQRLEDLASALKSRHPALQVHVVEQDLGQPGASSELFTKVSNIGDIDFLVNNAGFATSGAFLQNPIAKELELVDLNVRAVVAITRLFLPPMVERGSGRVLNVGSTAGFQPGPFMCNYYASKAFVNHFSEGLYEELLGTGVTCTLLAPGATRTEFAAVAGVASSRLFKLGSASPVDVARAGYRGMLGGRPVVIVGWLNWSLVQSLRVSPRWLSRKVAGLLNRQP
jgi:short-subunit dehydrogenase